MVPVVRTVIAVRPLSMAQIARGGGIHGSAPFAGPSREKQAGFLPFTEVACGGLVITPNRWPLRTPFLGATA